MTAMSSPPRCPACGHDEWSVAYKGLRDRVHDVPGEFDLWRCGSCGLLRLWPLPEDPASCYPEDYYSYRHTPQAPGGWRSALSGHARQWQLRTAWRAHAAGRKLPHWFTYYPWLRSQAYRELTEYAPAKAESLLDVGCGSGDFIAEARVLGMKVRGVEISESAVEVARGRGLSCDAGGLAGLAGTSERFDVIRLFHVLEHLEDPLEGLRTIVGALSPGGVAIIGVPNTDGLMARLCREDWHPLQIPRHLWGFEPRNLSLLLDQAGLDVRRIHHASYESNIYRSLCNLLETRAGLTLSEADPPKGVLSLCARIGWLIDPAELGDCLVVVAERSPTRT